MGVSFSLSCLPLCHRHSSTSHALRCSYSHSLSRYWCALDYDEDELRTDHYVYLCVTSIAGNAASSLTSFVPLEICKCARVKAHLAMSVCIFSLLNFETALTVFLPAPSVKPDPPSGVKVRKTAGRETYMKVTWNFPVSWKPEDFFFKLKYEIKYKPLTSSHAYEQVCFPVDVFVYCNALPALLPRNRYSLVSVDDSMMRLPGCLSVCFSLDKEEFNQDHRNH